MGLDPSNEIQHFASSGSALLVAVNFVTANNELISVR